MLGLEVRSASMACLLSQFKCPPDSLLLPKSTLRRQCKSKEFLCFQVQCMFSSTTVVEPEKLQIPSFEPLSASITSVKPLTYIGATGPPLKEEISTKLPAQSLLENEESVIAAAAAEAVALARAAVRKAKDAARMVGSYSLKQGKSEDALSEVEILQLEMARLFAKELGEETIHSTVTEAQSEDTNPNCSSLNVEFGIMGNESSSLEVQDPEGIPVKSTRQIERRARRARAVGKKGVDVCSTTSRSSRKKKHAISQQYDSFDPVGYVLPNAREYKLLTAKEEVELSLGIQVFLKLQRLKEELTIRNGSEPTLPQWAAAAGVDQQTLKKRLNYGSSCRDKMVYSNIRLVVKIARRYERARMSLDFQDLVQEGCRGLITGCERFDASKGFKFSTYATWWIKQAIKKALSENSRFIRLPYHIVGAQYKVNRATEDFRERHGRHPTEEEVVRETGLPQRRVRAVSTAPKFVLSLEQNMFEDSNMKRYEVMEDSNVESAESSFVKQLMSQELYAVLNKLKPREREVIRLRYGLEGSREMTLQEVGEVMDISRERVRQLEMCAFRKLKNKKKNKKLQQLQEILI